MKNQEFLKEWLRYIDLDITDNVPDGETYCVNGLHKEIWKRIKTKKNLQDCQLFTVYLM